ncbi:MAG: Omp28-related outer membrane protein [Sediminibacterium sp.]|nr:Omp28-related outer membrane protein [Sediminibacterium sp.]
MKKHLLTFFSAGFAVSAMAQLPASTSPQTKVAVLEEFTGINCTWCPDGHKIANQIKAANPSGKVLLVNIHTGGFANPSAGQPDYRTAEGAAIMAIPGMGVTGFPMGAVNRAVFSGTAMATSRTAWTANVGTVLTQTSYVNVACQATLDVNTRVITVDAQAYYTANSPTSNNFLTIALLEDNVVGPQVGGASLNPTQTNPDGSYNHQHMLRKVLTPTFGNTITTTSSGSTYNTQVSYTIPALYGAGTATNACNIGNLEIIAFVTENSQNKIISGASGPIQFTGIANALDAGVANLKVDNMVCAGISAPEFKMTNFGAATLTNVVVAYNVNGGTPQTYTWTGNCTSFQQKTINLPNINFTPASNNTLNINVVTANGVADPITSNNNVSKTTWPLTNLIANNINMQMNFTQDRYGSESTWEVRDEVTNALITSGGPYTDLAANGTALQTKTFTVNQNTCFKVKVNDSYGDGINAGYGAGNYRILSGATQTVYSSNGQYGPGELNYMKTSLTAGLNAESINVFSGISLAPNPSNGFSKLNVDMFQNDNVSVTVFNQLGQVVYEVSAKELSAGNHTFELNTQSWADGLYNVTVKGSNGTMTKKLTVAK